MSPLGGAPGWRRQHWRDKPADRNCNKKLSEVHRWWSFLGRNLQSWLPVKSGVVDVCYDCELIACKKQDCFWQRVHASPLQAPPLNAESLIHFRRQFIAGGGHVHTRSLPSHAVRALAAGHGDKESRRGQGEKRSRAALIAWAGKGRAYIVAHT